MGGYYATNRDIPEAAIAYDEKYVRDLFRKYGEIIGPVHYGSWCGREEYLDFQDIVVAEKYP
jgi:hypothetical protein